MKIELYINKQLCDLQEDTTIALKRVFFNPAELNTKDAQRSYSITLPATATNNEIFKHVNVEEVVGRFDKEYEAYLIVGGVTVLDGGFLMLEIGYNYYKGCLAVRADMTVKDIFGDMKMNQAGQWLEPFTSFPGSMNEYNQMDNPPFFFPYVLYGLLPKMKDSITGLYTSKTLWDNTVVLARDDFPPSINCLEAIRNIFLSKGYVISGTAYSDDRLKKLYMSYKNPVDYEMFWNYRGLVNLDLSGELSIDAQRFDVNEEKQVINYNILSNRSRQNVVVNDNKGDTYDRSTGIITIPVSGVYEIELTSDIILDSGEGWNRPYYNLTREITFSHADAFDHIKNTHSFEVKILKLSSTDTTFTDIDIDRKYGQPNINQNNSDWEYENSFPKYFPQQNKTMIVDASQNDRLICGISCGKDDLPEEAKQYYTPTPNPIIQNNGWSWNPKYKQDDENFITSNIEGYLEYTLENGSVSNISEYNKREIDNFTPNNAEYTDINKATGNVKCYVYLEKGEKIALLSSSSIDKFTVAVDGLPRTLPKCVISHTFNFNIKMRPIMYDKNFINTMIDSTEEYIDGNSDMLKDNIDLIKFLPSEQKVDEWLDNFCKAFNLQLSQDTQNSFKLNVRQKKRIFGGVPINMDEKANVNLGRVNKSLDLPTYYDIGFTINQDEQGYIETGEKGTELFNTGSITRTTLSQTSNFSFNWLKDIEYDVLGEIKTLRLPVITDKEIWKLNGVRDYEEMISKYYTDLAQRFWYKGDNFTYTYDRDKTFVIALVKNEIDNIIELNYYNRPLSILRTYFTIFTNRFKDYTIVQCLLTPEEYNRTPYSYVRFNGSIYVIAEIDKYNPLGTSLADIKLIEG